MSGSREKRGYALKSERGDRPFIYSAEHGDWKRAVKAGRSREAAAASEAWARRFRPRPRVASEAR